MTPDDRYHFEPLLLSVESAIARGETTGSYFHSEIRRLLRAAFDCGDHYIAGYNAATAAASPDDMDRASVHYRQGWEAGHRAGMSDAAYEDVVADLP